MGENYRCYLSILITGVRVFITYRFRYLELLSDSKFFERFSTFELSKVDRKFKKYAFIRISMQSVTEHNTINFGFSRYFIYNF